MAICRAYGNPDLFITFTCNTKWPEIERELDKSRGYKPEDKPDIITRVFRTKLLDMLKFIKSGAPFGETIADVHSIEFQKRGLPHTHILVWLASKFKFRTSADIDSIVSAEIPDKNIDPLCHDIVSKFMLHGPCGVAKPGAQCMSGNKNGIMLFNDSVVPYNKELLMRYNAHINVEICCQSMLIKYLFKYVNKSPDRCRAVLQHDRNDEVQAYLNCRFICPYEAVWRILQFPIHSRYPPIERLQIHLPFQQNIVFSGSNLFNLFLEDQVSGTQCLQNGLNATNNFLMQGSCIILNFLKKYVWDSRQKQWTMRSKGFSLGRIPYVHPAAGELYFLRLLLHHVKGSISFADLRNVHGILHPTFQLACKAHGLLGDDKEWSEAFCEAIATASSPQLRQLFVGIILFCQVADPLILFNQFWRSMYDDILYKLKSSFRMPNLILPDDQLKNYVLYELEQLFNASATTLRDHCLPMPDGQLLKEITNKLLREELDYDLSELRTQHSLNFASLNIQRVIYDSIIAAIFAKKQALVFVHGHGGTGKTFLWHTIINRVRSESLIVCSSIIWYCISSLPNVWDEAPMVNKCCLEALDRSMRDVLSEGPTTTKIYPLVEKPFYLVVIFDKYCQLFPVEQRANNQCFFDQLNFGQNLLLTLTENMRLSTVGLSLEEKAEIREFSEWILSVGNGQISDLPSLSEADESFVTIPFHLLLRASCDPIPTIVSTIYPNICDVQIDPGYYRERAIVTTKNTTVAEINDFVLRITPGTKRVYLSVDSVSTSSTESDDASSLYPIEYINQLEFNGVPSHELALKIGTPVMLLRNISPSIGYAMGLGLSSQFIKSS
uniref:ATP-dependent DNA helicase n=1 Tax=Salix viminalis TaxID=40686 RepID=A0A6N2LP42_SALVM